MRLRGSHLTDSRVPRSHVVLTSAMLALAGCPTSSEHTDAMRPDGGLLSGCDTPGTIERVSCGACATVDRFCTAERVWTYGACEGAGGECMPGTTRMGACGNCGTGEQRCDATCTWASAGPCFEEGECASGAMRRSSEGCPTGQARDFTCSAACTYEPTSTCASDCVLETGSVDILFMIDNSSSMTEEQASLTAELPGMLRALASGDVEGDGTAEFMPLGSLHVGVITSDMGTGPYAVPSCGRFGDDGVLRTLGAPLSGCMSSYSPVFEFMSGDDPAMFAARLACVATVGTGGCGFEQQLEATLKALSPATATAWTAPGYVPPVFFDATSGHALDTNAGFIRDDSLLVVVIVSDEEDSSALDPDLFNPSSPRYGSMDLNLRGFRFPGALHPVSRYVEGLARLRVEPERLLVASIVGLPLAAEPTTVVPDYDAILADPGMIERIDPSVGNRLVPSCETPRGIAFPPRRILTMQRELERRGVGTTTGSICQSSYTEVTTRILTRIAERLPGDCP